MLHSSPDSFHSMMSSLSLSRNVPNHELVSELPEATATKMPASTAPGDLEDPGVRVGARAVARPLPPLPQRGADHIDALIDEPGDGLFELAWEYDAREVVVRPGRDVVHQLGDQAPVFVKGKEVRQRAPGY